MYVVTLVSASDNFSVKLTERGPERGFKLKLSSLTLTCSQSIIIAVTKVGRSRRVKIPHLVGRPEACMMEVLERGCLQIKLLNECLCSMFSDD